MMRMYYPGYWADCKLTMLDLRWGTAYATRRGVYIGLFLCV